MRVFVSNNDIPNKHAVGAWVWAWMKARATTTMTSVSALCQRVVGDGIGVGL